MHLASQVYPLEEAPPHAARGIARLHADAISAGFLSTLGCGFLTALYRGIAAAPGSTVLVAMDLETVAGFAAVTVDTGSMYRHVIRRHWPRLALAAAPRAFGYRPLTYVWETMRYPQRTEAGQANDGMQAELLSIAVDRSRRGAGVGRLLLSGVDRFFRENDIVCYKVVTAADDAQSNAFYQACGFTPVREFVHHGHTMKQYEKGSSTGAHR
jgi:GNAT superfamily N-acetyltransferase